MNKYSRIFYYKCSLRLPWIDIIYGREFIVYELKTKILHVNLLKEKPPKIVLIADEKTELLII